MENRKKMLILAMAALTLGVSQNVLAQDSQSHVEEKQQIVRDSEGNIIQDNSTSTTTTKENDSRISKGGLFIEPILFASQEDQTIKTSQIPLVAGDTTNDARGYGLGLRFGGHVSEILLLGLDGRYSKVDTDDSFYSKEDANVYNIAPMVGLQTPLFGIRILAGYVVAGENNPGTSADGLDLKFKEATGWRLGAGVHVGPVAINLEYQDLTYNKTEIESLGQVAINNDTNIDMESEGYALSVSFPIEL